MSKTLEASTFAGAAERPETAGTRSVVLAMDLRTNRTPPPNVEASDPFFLKAHPDRWTVVGGTVVPAFGKLKLTPGINGVGQDQRTKRISFRPAQAQAEDAGWIIIPWNAVPPKHLQPGEVPSYLVQVEGRPDVYLSRYEIVYPGSAIRGTDEKGFLEFCAYLEEQKIIQPPPLYVLETLLDRKKAELNSALDKAHRTNRNRATVERLELDVEAVERAIKARRQAPAAHTAASVQLEESAPEPAPRPRTNTEPAADAAQEKPDGRGEAEVEGGDGGADQPAQGLRPKQRRS